MISQIGIAIFGVIAVWLSQEKREHYRKYASVFGLLGQPFWFYAAFSNRQYGMVFICTLYTIAWAKGFVRLLPTPTTEQKGEKD